MKAMDFLASLQGMHGVFTLMDTERITGKRGKYASLFLGRLCKRGIIRRIERGRYYLPGTPVYAIASSVAQPSYISLLAAFRYHNITTQNVAAIDVMALKRHSPIGIEGISVHFTVLSRSRFFGFYVDRESGASVAYAEKAIIDALHLGNPPYAYVEEAFVRATEAGIIDPGRMDAFALRMGSDAVTEGIARLRNAVRKNIARIVSYGKA